MESSRCQYTKEKEVDQMESIEKKVKMNKNKNLEIKKWTKKAMKFLEEVINQTWNVSL